MVKGTLSSRARVSASRVLPLPVGPISRMLDLPSSTDRKSTRLNSSHVRISYAVFCLKKKTSDFKTNTRPHTYLPGPLADQVAAVLHHAALSLPLNPTEVEYLRSSCIHSLCVSNKSII